MKPAEGHGDARGTAPEPGLEDLYAAIRAVTRSPDDWECLAETVAAAVRPILPSATEVLPAVPADARYGADQGQVLHVEADGSFSVVALVTRPGYATSIHDHTSWCVVGVVAGQERDERFRVAGAGGFLELTGTRIDEAGTVTGFAPPGDIHRVENFGDGLGVSLHIYGTDINRIGNSIRRIYDLPVRHAR
jgi:predicted metal-dependent enzyme (double-stranded beta helix superfamily)